MKYYKLCNALGEIEALGSVYNNAKFSSAAIEITQEEYEALLASLPQPKEPAYTDDATEALAILHGEEVE